jgi:uncharacterized protein (TIGR02271 family)
MATISRDRVQHFRGHDLYDRDGSKIGAIEEIYLDTETNEPEWALVHTGLFGTKRTFVPLRDASERDEDLSVPFEKSQVKDAPGIDPNGQLSQNEEAELYRHYGLEYSDRRSDTGLAEGTSGTAGAGGTLRDRDHVDRGTVGRDVSGPTTDDAMTRSEEELRVGTTEREAGRARLKKYVVTENETRTVPVKREEVRVEREPITEGNVDRATSGPEISEEEHEVVLHEEEVVTDKRAVPKERVRLEKDVEVDEETISEDVRKERIDVDDAGGTTRR